MKAQTVVSPAGLRLVVFFVECVEACSMTTVTHLVCYSDRHRLIPVAPNLAQKSRMLCQQVTIRRTLILAGSTQLHMVLYRWKRWMILNE